MDNFDRLVRAGLNGHPQQQAQVQIATPINDVQLVALVAASLGDYDAVQDRVNEALDIVAETLAQMNPGLRNVPPQPPETLAGRAQAKLAMRG